MVANETSARNDELLEYHRRTVRDRYLSSGVGCADHTTDVCIARIDGTVKFIQIEQFDCYRQDDLNLYGHRNSEVVSPAPCVPTNHCGCTRTCIFASSRNPPRDRIDSWGGENTLM